MFMIPGRMIALLTFPGVMLHEWAHKVFCARTGVTVHRVKYFQFQDPAGYVLHAPPDTYAQTFWISIGPLVVNSAVAILLGIFATQTRSSNWLTILLCWVAISAGMHSFPSDHDMQHVAAGSKAALGAGGSLVHYLAFPFVALIWIANKLRFFWIDAFYAVLLVGLGMQLGGGVVTKSTPASSAGSVGLSATDQDTVIAGEYRCPIAAARAADQLAPDAALKASIDDTTTTLEAQARELAELSGSIDSDNVDRTSQTAIDRHNALVESYKSQLALYRAAYTTYSTNVDTFNAAVDSYNSYVSQHCHRN